MREQGNPAELLCAVMKRIYDRNLTSLTGGNLSMMDDEGVMWTTPSGIDKGTLRPEDIVRVLPDGTWEGAHRPTSEYRIHHQILKRRPDLKAVLHAHCPSMTALSIARENVRTDLDLASRKLCGSSVVTDYTTPGTQELADVVEAAFAEGCDSSVLENHAVFTSSAAGLWDGYARLEQLEWTAAKQLCTPLLGEGVVLGEEDYAAYCGARRADAELLGAAGGAAAGEDEKCEAGLLGAAGGAAAGEDEKCEAGMLGAAGGAAAGEDENREAAARGQLAVFTQRAYGKKLLSEGFGTFSVRLGDDSFLIAPEKKSNSSMTAEDFVRIDLSAVRTAKEGAAAQVADVSAQANGVSAQAADVSTPAVDAEGKQENTAVCGGGRRADCDWRLHAEIYRRHPEVNCILLAAPVWLSAYANSGTPYEVDIAAESYGVLRADQRFSFAEFTAISEIAEKMDPAHPFALIASVGALVVGPNLTLTFDKMEVAEYAAQSLAMVKMSGNTLHPLTKEQLKLTES